MVSMKDIATACGVSVATVSKSLNGYSDISAETKALIQQKAKELGYFPNSAARALKTNRTFNIGVVLTDDSGSGLAHEYFANLLQSVRAEVEKNGFDITFVSNSLGGKKMTYYEHCKYRGVDGVIVACADFQSEELEELVHSDLPVVIFDHVYDEGMSVLSDNKKGIAELVKYVYDNGHRRIAYIHGEFSQVTNTRVAAYKETMAKLGLEVPKEYVREAAYHDPDKVHDIAIEMLQLKEPPTCILYPDDFTALAGMSRLRQAGYSVPDDLTVAGYDGLMMGQVLYPKLTTIGQDTDRMGKEAAKQLIDCIEHPDKQKKKQVVIRGHLIEGETVTRLKNRG